MKNINYNEMTTPFLDQLPKGAFLTVRSGDQLNTMTIGWGSIGFMWQKPVMMVMVRNSRFTHELLKDAPDFTVSLPLDKGMKASLAAAGTKSGRDINKFETYKLTAQTAQIVESPVIGDCGLFYECKILYRQPMDLAGLKTEVKESCYGDDDLHVLYYGEIVACYTQE